jgi:hypothetical protein
MQQIDNQVPPSPRLRSILDGDSTGVLHVITLLSIIVYLYALDMV